MSECASENIHIGNPFCSIGFVEENEEDVNYICDF